MARLEPQQLWWTSDELAASGLPQMPGTKRGVNVMAERGAWRSLSGAARKKPDRGGGWQYHWSVLTVEAQRALLARTTDRETSRPDRGSAWAEFDRLPDTVKAKAQARLEIIKMVDAIRAAGNSRVALTA